MAPREARVERKQHHLGIWRNRRPYFATADDIHTLPSRGKAEGHLAGSPLAEGRARAGTSLFAPGDGRDFLAASATHIGSMYGGILLESWVSLTGHAVHRDCGIVTAA
jgi:hypothetical protein